MSQELLTLVQSLRRRNARETPATGSADPGRGIAAPPETPSPRSSAQRLGPFGFAGDVKSAEKLQRVLQALDTPPLAYRGSLSLGNEQRGKHFAGVFIILNNPGMKPSVRESSLRTATPSELDEDRGDWRCTDMGVVKTIANRYWSVLL